MKFSDSSEWTFRGDVHGKPIRGTDLYLWEISGTPTKEGDIKTMHYEKDSKIEDCPFCGSDEVAVAEGLNNNSLRLSTGDYWVHCLRCLAQGPMMKTEELAIYQWNEVAKRKK